MGRTPILEIFRDGGTKAIPYVVNPGCSEESNLIQLLGSGLCETVCVQVCRQCDIIMENWDGTNGPYGVTVWKCPDMIKYLDTVISIVMAR